MLSYQGSLNSGYGVDHFEEGVYLFNPPNSNLTKDDLGVREILVSGWANFAKTGTPNVPTTDFWQKSSWKGSWPVNYMNITGPYSFAMEARPETAKRVEFWEGFL